MNLPPGKRPDTKSDKKGIPTKTVRLIWGTILIVGAIAGYLALVSHPTSVPPLVSKRFPESSVKRTCRSERNMFASLSGM